MHTLRRQIAKAILVVMVANSCSTAQAIDFSELTNRIYKQGTEFCSRLKKSNAYKQCATYGKKLLTKEGPKDAAKLLIALGILAVIFKTIAPDPLAKYPNDGPSEGICVLNDELSTKCKEIRTFSKDVYPNASSRIRGLILCGADPNSTDCDLLASGVKDINSGLNRTALHCAVLHKDTSMVHFLLQHGANPFLRDHLNRSPYTIAEGMDDLDPYKAKLLALLP